MQIIIDNLSKEYMEAGKPLKILSDLSAVFEAENSTAIVGRSGVGKSTLLNLLGGLDAPTSGSVFYGSNEISKMNSDERSLFRLNNICFIFQFHHLLPEFDAEENVAMPLVISGISMVDAKPRARELLSLVGLENRLSHRPGQLSGGEQQRVAIARSLVHEPKVILADEPTGNLDPQSRIEVQELMLRAVNERGVKLVVVTHDLELASALDETFEMSSSGKLEKLIK